MATLLVLLLPLLLVITVKKTSLGPILDAPKTRQKGDPKAKIVIVEYSDFQCPSCAAMQPTVRQLLETYQGKVRLVYKYYPLSKLHKNTMIASHAAECAAEQNRFWDYADQLFSTQHQWESLADPSIHFSNIAIAMKLDLPTFQACFTDPLRMKVIEKDMEEGRARGIRATPTFFIGSERLVANYLASDGARIIERELRGN